MTPAFDRYVAPARRRPQLWRLLLGCVVALIVYLVGITIILTAGYVVTVLRSGDGAADDWIFRLAESDTPGTLLITLSTFAAMAAAAWAAARWVHKRTLAELIGPAPWRPFAIAAGTVGAIYGLSVLVWLAFNDPLPGLEPSLWLTLLPLAIPLLLLQTGAEELVFRGYLQGQLAARFASPLAWLVLPAVAFGAVHYDPVSAGENALLIVAAATAFGLIAGDLTRITGNLGAAWGFHFANNAFALLILATQGALPGMALYLTPYSVDDPEAMRATLLADAATLAATWLIVRTLVRRLHRRAPGPT